MDETENNNYLSLSKLNCTIEDFTPDILNLVKAKKKGELYRKFAQKFLTYIPADYRLKDKISLFGYFSIDMSVILKLNSELLMFVAVHYACATC